MTTVSFSQTYTLSADVEADSISEAREIWREYTRSLQELPDLADGGRGYLSADGAPSLWAQCPVCHRFWEPGDWDDGNGTCPDCQDILDEDEES
jgi:hypothetical protein